MLTKKEMEMLDEIKNGLPSPQLASLLRVHLHKTECQSAARQEKEEEGILTREPLGQLKVSAN